MATKNKTIVSQQTTDSPAPALDAATQQRVRAVKLGISLDGWAVLAAILLAALVRLNWLPAIGWFK